MFRQWWLRKGIWQQEAGIRERQERLSIEAFNMNDIETNNSLTTANANALRVVFLGTGDIALPCLRMLISSDWLELIGVITQPDKPVGRKQITTPPQVKVLAEQAGVPVFQPENVSDPESIEVLRAWNADVIIVMAYGQILKQVIMDSARLACINVHASLLPKYRGASCIQAAIAAGDAETGVTIMHVVRKLDAGDMILKSRIPILPGDTGGSLHDKLADLSPAALEEALMQLRDDTATREVQNEAEFTYAPKLLRHHGDLDWSKPADAIERLVRAYEPWPGTATSFKDARGAEKRLKIFPPVEIVDAQGPSGTVAAVESDALTIYTGDQALRIFSVQPEGKQRMGAGDFLRGAGIVEGTAFFKMEA